MSFLDSLFSPGRWFNRGVELVSRQKIDLADGTLVGVDNPATGRTELSVDTDVLFALARATNGRIRSVTRTLHYNDSDVAVAFNTATIPLVDPSDLSDNMVLLAAYVNSLEGADLFYDHTPGEGEPPASNIVLKLYTGIGEGLPFDLVDETEIPTSVAETTGQPLTLMPLGDPVPGDARLDVEISTDGPNLDHLIQGEVTITVLYVLPDDGSEPAATPVTSGTAIQLPRFTTAERDAAYPTPTGGLMIYNTTLGVAEYYSGDAAAWIPLLGTD